MTCRICVWSGFGEMRPRPKVSMVERHSTVLLSFCFTVLRGEKAKKGKKVETKRKDGINVMSCRVVLSAWRSVN